MPILETPVDSRYSGVWGTYASGGFHPAVDYPLVVGTPLRALDSGVVTTAGWSLTGYGNQIRVKMDQTGHTVIYGHCSQLLHSKGQRVEMGQTVARSGNSGNSTGPHCHVEVRTSSWLQSTAYNFTRSLWVPAKILSVSACRVTKDNYFVARYQRLLWNFQTEAYRDWWVKAGWWNFDTKGFPTTYGPLAERLTRDTYKRLNGTSSTEPGPWLVKKIGGAPLP